MQTTFTIGELATEFGVTLRTLRFYEDKGLISPQRQGVNRIYTRRDRARLKLILLGKQIGLPLGEIKDMLGFYDLKDARPTQLRLALAHFGQQIERLTGQKAAIEQAVGELTRTVGLIQGMLDARESTNARMTAPALEAAE
jgi:DNA-binding transcriptional MerR regulator